MIANFFLFVTALFRLSSTLMRSHFSFRKKLEKTVTEVYQEKGEAPDADYFKRIYYYGILGSVMSDWFTILRGYRPDQREAIVGFYLGVGTAVYDDLFDHYQFTKEESLVDLASGQYKYDNVTERLSKLFYDQILAHLQDEKSFTYYLEKVGTVQEESKQQASGQLSTTALRRITYDKGGYSFLLMRCLLKHELPTGEERAIYLLGSLIQLTNDVFDLRKDHLNQVATLATTATDIREVKREYMGLVQQCFDAFKKLSYSSSAFRRFFMQVLILVSRGMVCLDQLVRVQERHGGDFTIEKYSRAELVCDMERPINLLRSFWYCLTWKW